MKMVSSDIESTRKFLIHCLRAFLAAEGTPSGTPLEEKVDWNALVQLAAFHRVAPLLDRALRNGCPQAAPASVLADLAAYVRSASIRSLLLTGELVRLLKRLEAQGIPAIPFKGPVLASLLYGDPALRHFDDLDVLVCRENYASAEQLLLSLGYQPEFQLLTSRQEKAYLQNRFHAHFALARGDSRIDVELHWDIMPEYFPFHSDLKGTWKRCGLLSFGGANVTTLSPEDLLLFLCVHGSRHLWLRLQWLCDIAQLVRRHATMNWDRVVEQAKIAGGQRMLFLGIFLANDILGAPLPREIEQEVRRDSHTVKLANQVRWRLFEEPLLLFKPWKGVHFRLQLMDRAWDHLSYSPRRWLQILMIPTLADWSSLPLPDILFPLYYVLRPMRLAGRYGAMAVNYIYNWCKVGNTTKERRNSSPEEKDLTR